MVSVVQEELMGPREIAQLLGVTQGRVSQLARDYDDFLRPVAELAIGRVWRRADIEAWIARHPDRRPGRRRKDR